MYILHGTSNVKLSILIIPTVTFFSICSQMIAASAFTLVGTVCVQTHVITPSIVGQAFINCCIINIKAINTVFNILHAMRHAATSQ